MKEPRKRPVRGPVIDTATVKIPDGREVELESRKLFFKTRDKVCINTADPGPEGFAVRHSKETIKMILESL